MGSGVQDAAAPVTVNDLSKGRGGRYNSFVAYCFVVNYVLGVGILGIPNAFVKAGLLLGALVLATVAVITGITIMWLVEVGARAQEYVLGPTWTARVLGGTEGTPLLPAKDDDAAFERAPNGKLPSPDDAAVNGEDAGLSTDALAANAIWKRKYEVVTLSDMFLGKAGSFAYQLALAIYMYSSLWAYATVFSTGVREKFHPSSFDCDQAIYLYLGIYALIAVPLSCLDLAEQVIVQVILTMARFLAVGVMVISAFWAIGHDPLDRYSRPNSSDCGQHPPGQLVPPIHGNGTDGPPYIAYTDLAHISGFGVIVTTSVFAMMTQHSIPGLTEPVRDKSKLHAIFVAAVLTTGALYAILGFAAVLYFGENTNQSVNLNWSEFRFNVPATQPLPAWVYLLTYIVVLFPPVDTLSAFPLTAITLGNNMLYMLPQKWAGSSHKQLIKIAFRLIAAVPPLFAALAYRQLETILQIAGFFGLYVGLFTPCLLMFFSRRACMRDFHDEIPTRYATRVSHRAVLLFVFLFALASVGLTVYANFF